MKNQNNKFLNQLFADQVFRREAARQSHNLFFPLYLSGYIKYPTAPFHREIIKLTEKENVSECFIMAFRGSGKSTIVSTSYPIWAILGIQQKKLVVIISQTQNQSRFILNNIRRELEGNELLINDFGPFNNNSSEWSSNVLDIPKYEARIVAASSGERIRGLRHGPYRPDLVILDDVEDISSVKTLDSREGTYQWFNNEVTPLGDIGTRIIVVGNMLHEDSLMMKLQEYDDKIGVKSVFISYPLMDEDNNSLWPEKFTKTVIENLKRSAISPQAFEMEYMLRPVSNEQQVILRDWIQYYDFTFPNRELPPPREIIISTDLAIKKGDGRDKTAIIVLYVTGFGKNLQVYLLPDIINEQLDFTEQVVALENLYLRLQHMFNILPRIYIEDIAYQAALAQELLRVNKLPAEPVKIGQQDKATRLALVSPYIKTGKVFFPKNIAETLINQILNIYSTKYDDLADALSLGLGIVVKHDWPSYDDDGSNKQPRDDDWPPKPETWVT